MKTASRTRIQQIATATIALLLIKDRVFYYLRIVKRTCEVGFNPRYGWWELKCSVSFACSHCDWWGNTVALSLCLALALRKICKVVGERNQKMFIWISSDSHLWSISSHISFHFSVEEILFALWLTFACFFLLFIYFHNNHIAPISHIHTHSSNLGSLRCPSESFPSINE